MIICCSYVNGFVTSAARPQSNATTNWKYVGLTAVQVNHTLYGPELKLLCHEDAGSGCFTVRCDHRHAPLLHPYTALLNASEDGSIDPPVVPIHSAGGSSTFSPSGARYDYPELRVSAQLPCLLPRSTELG